MRKYWRDREQRNRAKSKKKKKPNIIPVLGEGLSFKDTEVLIPPK